MATERNPFDRIPQQEDINVSYESSSMGTDQGQDMEFLEEQEVEFMPEDDGSVVVQFGPYEDDDDDDTSEVDAEELEFYRNLVDDLDEEQLTEISAEVYDNFIADKDSREEWESMFERGFDLLGLKLEETSEPFEGACTAVHPVLIESAVKFQSKATQELFPPSGPVKTQIMGEVSEEKEAQGTRVKDFMNYQTTEQMPEYFDEFERMLFQLPIIGSAFKKIYFDSNINRPVSEFVPIDQFYVSYYATDLRRADRYTHVLYKSPYEMAGCISSGMYSDDVDLPKATTNPTPGTLREKMDNITGLTPSSQNDPQYTLLEQHVNLSINLDGPSKNKKKSDSDDEDEPVLDMDMCPYIVTIEEVSRKILSIRRNWNEDDKRKEKKLFFTHYRYVPGFGFYGLGLIHLLGNLTMTATAAMRGLVDAGQFANLPGGFKAKGLRIVGDNDPIAPGEFKEVESVGNDLSKMIIPLPYKEPSQTLFQMLGFVAGAAQKFADTTEQVISEGANYGPVGTTMALLEASSKFFTAVHKRIHKAQRDEFKILGRINNEYLPDSSSIDVANGTLIISKADFDGRIDIIPVSDPNIPSSAHRMMMAQMALQLSQSAPPGMFNVEELNRTILSAANIPNLDKIMPRKPQPIPLDPISDVAAAVKGLAIKAFVGQNHDAHLQAKTAFLQDPMNGGNPAMQRIVPILQANMQEHVLLKYQEQVNGVAKDIISKYGQEASNAGVDPNDPKVMEMVLAQAAVEVQQANAVQAQQQNALTPEAQMVKLEEQRVQLEAAKLQADTASESAKAELKNRELDLEELQIKMDMFKSGAELTSTKEEKEMDRHNKTVNTALKALADLAQQEDELDNSQTLKAADMMAKMLELQAKNNKKD
tara:strand:+ start:1720 stop:4344 length:2625 start_codon:yes stop_codon:yes gene_type:complete